MKQAEWHDAEGTSLGEQASKPFRAERVSKESRDVGVSSEI